MTGMESFLDRPPVIARESRVDAVALSGVSYPVQMDPAHAKAWAKVSGGWEDWSEVRDPATGYVAFQAYRVSPMSWTWQTPQMAVPAFASYGYGLPLPEQNERDESPEARRARFIHERDAAIERAAERIRSDYAPLIEHVAPKRLVMRGRNRV
ncbi:MAG TPA: hypothetical protein VFI15_04795 [Candidatus Limnocylindrales bacterium]|nr:hypothetical protein [Candidatus Limnocylindrales bacterium]